ncbi:hypothetical protein GCM10027186_18930 [Micromonospora schwarzwaldensis]
MGTGLAGEKICAGEPRHPRRCGILFFKSRDKIRQDVDGPSGREVMTDGVTQVEPRLFSGLHLMLAARVGAMKSRGLRTGGPHHRT